MKVKSILWQAWDKPMTLLYNKEKVSRKGVKELLFGLQLAKFWKREGEELSFINYFLVFSYGGE